MHGLPLTKYGLAFASGALKSALVCYVALCAFLAVFQSRIIFHPSKGDVSLDARYVPGGSAVRIPSGNGESIVAWWRPPSVGSETILYLHGNGRSLSERLTRLSLIAGQDRGLLAVSWRGFGGSSGSPSHDAFEEDSDAAYAWLSQRVAPSSVVVFGESLGTAMAVRVASKNAVAGVVLDSPFASMGDLAWRRFPYVPTSLLLRHPFDAASMAPMVTAPVLVTRCRRDGLTPFESASVLLERFASKVTDVVVDGHCHIPFMRAAYGATFDAWLASLRSGRVASGESARN